MAYENLLYEKRDRIGFITFNRPKVLNALNRKTMEELNHILIAAIEGFPRVSRRCSTL